MAQHLHLALTLAGYLGGLLVLLGHGLTSTGRLPASSPAAQAVNALGATLMLANGVVLAAWASVGVNAAWIGIGALTLWRTHLARRGPRGPVEEIPAGALPAPSSAATVHAEADAWSQDWDAAAEQLGDAPTLAPVDDGTDHGAGGPAPSYPATTPLPALDARGHPLR